MSDNTTAYPGVIANFTTRSQGVAVLANAPTRQGLATPGNPICPVAIYGYPVPGKVSIEWPGDDSPATAPCSTLREIDSDSTIVNT